MSPFSALCRADAVRVVALAIALLLLSISGVTAAQPGMACLGRSSNSSSVPSLGLGFSWRDGLLLNLKPVGNRLGENLELVGATPRAPLHLPPSPGNRQGWGRRGARGERASSVAGAATTDATPIVMVVGDDPVVSGIVASMAHPGGRVTGLAFQTDEGDVKRSQLMRCPSRCSGRSGSCSSWPGSREGGFAEECREPAQR